MKRRVLTSDANPRVKLARKLHLRRHRETEGLFLLEGPHLLEAALEAGAAVREVLCTAAFAEAHAALAERLDGAPWPVWEVSVALLGRLAATEEPQGVVAIAELLPDAAEPPLTPDLLVLALEAVSDPGNVGSALRAAHAAGASCVVLGPGCCDRFNAKAVRASAGGLFAVPARSVEDLAGLLRRLRDGGAAIAVAEPRGATRCWEADLCGPTVLVVGSEAHGVSDAVRAEATDRVAIPMPGRAESLNAAAAAAILLYEALRQRLDREAKRR
ncbi:MAG TPA: RNA methyltransferase [Planctomycetota bacterium]|nr:RNA methyltransferase [Planctomycetota bacterium]